MAFEKMVLGMGEGGCGRPDACGPSVAWRPLTADPAWPTDFAAARAIQLELAARVVEALPEGFMARRIAGVDVHFGRDGETAFGAAVVLDLATLDLVESALAAVPLALPYRAGFLSFREVPAALAALAMLRTPFDVVMVDGQGRAHPRRFGFACHLGVLLERPTIGVAKSRLTGRFAEPGADAGSTTPLEDGAEMIGAVVRSKPRCRPLFVSVGHRIDLETALALVRATTGRYRLPEPTRLADRLSRAHG